MKRAVSISIGSSKRNKSVELELLGEKVIIERIGTDGDMQKAAQLFKELDGQVDAFGLGGADMGALIDGKWYLYHNVKFLYEGVKKTPIVDGLGLKHTLENKVGPYIEDKIGEYIQPKRVLLTAAGDRWGMTKSFLDLNYDCVFGELMFGLGIPIPIKSVRVLKTLSSIAYPIVMRFPFQWIYPTGEKQEVRVPKFEEYYQWATVIAGDRHYVVRHMPERLDGKVIVTNTTTTGDKELFQKSGVKYLVTTTPVLEGRSFGTNMMEAALVAISGKGRKLTLDELDELINQLGFEPQIQELN